jgi:hypothetical protein
MAVVEKKKAEEKAKRFEEENMKIEHNLADIIRREEDKFKMKKIKICSSERKLSSLCFSCCCNPN